MIMLKEEFVEFVKNIDFNYVEFDVTREDTPDIETVDVRIGACESCIPFTPKTLLGTHKLFINCKLNIE